jgi:hypothetical protein
MVARALFGTNVLTDRSICGREMSFCLEDQKAPAPQSPALGLFFLGASRLLSFGYELGRRAFCF